MKGEKVIVVEERQLRELIQEAIVNLESNPKIAYTAKEVAKLIGVSERTVRSKMSNGELPTVRINSIVRVTRQDLLKFLENRKK